MCFFMYFLSPLLLACDVCLRQGLLLEKDLGVMNPTNRKCLVRSMKWKLWGMGEEPPAPEKLLAKNASCGAVRIEWNPSESNPSFPVHKFVLRRASLVQEGEGTGEWVTVMDGPDRSFFDARLNPGAAYRYSLQAWNALGHSSAVDVDVLVATEDCAPGAWWLGAGGYGAGVEPVSELVPGVIAALVGSAAAALYLVTRGGRTGRSDEDPSGRRNNGDRRGARGERPEALPPPASVGGADGGGGGGAVESDGRLQGSPIPGSSNGVGGWSDRERNDQRRRISGASMSSSSLRTMPAHKGALKRASSDAAAVTGSTAVGRDGAPSGGNGGAGREPSSRRVSEVGAKAAAAESIRKEASRRFMTRKSTSREEKDGCTLCHKEWRW